MTHSHVDSPAYIALTVVINEVYIINTYCAYAIVVNKVTIMTCDYPQTRNINNHLHMSQCIRMLSQNSSPETHPLRDVTFRVGPPKCQFLPHVTTGIELQAFGLYSAFI